MERFALAAAVVLGFALTAALCSLFVPLRRVLERREQQQQPVQSEQPRPAPLRAPLWGGLCAAAGTVAAVGVGWLAACVGQPELLGSEGRLMTRLLTALAGSLAFGAVGLAEDLARMRSPAALGLRRDVRLLLEALAAAFVLLLLRAAGCLPRGLGVPGAGYVLLGSAVPFLWAVLMVALAECARIAERDEGAVCGAAFVAMLALMMVEAGLGVGVLDGTDGLFVQDMGTLDVLAQGLAGDGGHIQIQQALLCQLCLHRRDAARCVQIRHMGGACRCQMAQVGGLGADLVEQLQVDGHTGLVGDSQQVQHRVSGAAQRHITGQRVADGALVDDLACGDALAHHLHHSHTGVLCQLQALGVHSRDGAVAGQGDADGLAQAVHAVGGVHTGAAAAAGAAVAGAVFQLLVGDHARLVSTHSLEHLGKADFLAAVAAGQHGAAGADHRGHIHADRGHDHAGHDLIAVGHQHQTVQLMGHQHGLHAVTDQLAGGQGVLHAHMAHGDAIADTDGRDQDGGAARHLHTGLDGIGDLIQIHVAGHDLAVSADHADQRALQLLGGVTQCVE